ncbi:hypothetical protein HanHA300_Chr13g0504051 [Helianthus annuus]|nr:hypothetical protein HanHA300_Chr13g0504051 [Helianthus annuus]
MVLIISPFIISLNMRQFYGVFCLLMFDYSFCTGSPLDSRPATPLPDRNLLVFILDSLQKKDTHAIFSEPVNPNEVRCFVVYKCHSLFLF